MSNLPSPPTNTFEDFKRSFSYGSRNDLNFKFLAGLSDESRSLILSGTAL